MPHPRNSLHHLIDSVIDAALDAAEEGLSTLFPHLSQPAPPGPTHKRPRNPHPTTRSNPLPPRPKVSPRPPRPPSTPPPAIIPDHYATLGLHPSAHPATIRAAYASLARLYHPDFCPGQKGKEKAAKKMLIINEAYAVLKDPAKKAEYDAVRKGRGL